jgi:hypothetical protein
VVAEPRRHVKHFAQQVYAWATYESAPLNSNNLAAGGPITATPRGEMLETRRKPYCLAANYSSIEVLWWCRRGSGKRILLATFSRVACDPRHRENGVGAETSWGERDFEAASLALLRNLHPSCGIQTLLHGHPSKAWTLDTNLQEHIVI